MNRIHFGTADRPQKFFHRRAPPSLTTTPPAVSNCPSFPILVVNHYTIERRRRNNVPLCPLQDRFVRRR